MEDRLRMVGESCDQLVSEASRMLSGVTASGQVVESADFGLVNNVEEIQTTAHAQRMVQAAEALFNVIYDLRLSWSLYGHERHLKQVNRSIESAGEQSEIVKYKISRLQAEVEKALTDLSSHYAVTKSPSISSFIQSATDERIK